VCASSTGVADGAAVKTSPSTVETSVEARTSAGGKRMRHASMVESAERAGVDARRRARVQATVVRRSGMRDIIVRSSAGGMSRLRMFVTEVRVPEIRAMEVRVMVESRTVRAVPVMIVQDVVPVPIGSPVMPAPTKASEDTDPDTQAERNSRAIDVEARDPDPCGVVWKRLSVDNPWIVLGYVNDIRICRFDRDRLPVRRDTFLLRALQVPSLLCPPTHYLNCVEYVLLPSDVRITERRRP